MSFVLWVLCELAIAACDLAEVIGSAIALNLLFGIPLAVGVVLTALDVLLVLLLQRNGFRMLEALVISLVALIGGCFLFEILISQPDVGRCWAASSPASRWCATPRCCTSPWASWAPR